TYVMFSVHAGNVTGIEGLAGFPIGFVVRILLTVRFRRRGRPRLVSRRAVFGCRRHRLRVRRIRGGCEPLTYLLWIHLHRSAVARGVVRGVADRDGVELQLSPAESTHPLREIDNILILIQHHRFRDRPREVTVRTGIGQCTGDEDHPADSREERLLAPHPVEIATRQVVALPYERQRIRTGDPLLSRTEISTGLLVVYLVTQTDLYASY